MPPPPDLEQLLATSNYPGMIPAESRILRAFLERHARQYDEIRFNERLGQGVILENPATEKDRRDWERRTRARPDCIAWLAPRTATIIEAKQQATLETVWQVVSYRELYARTFQAHQALAIIVCESALPNVAPAAAGQRVRVLTYTFPTDQPLAPGVEGATT